MNANVLAPKVALILDSAVVAHVLGAACVEEGAEPMRFDSGARDLVERLAELGPAVVVVRRTLEHRDGLDLCRDIRGHARLRHARVILVSSEAAFATEAIAAGAHAHLVLPCRAPDARAAIRAQLDADPVVLLVDDSRAQRLLLLPALRAEGWDVIEAEDGVEACERLKERGGIDLVISDIEMPRMDGWALCAALKANPRTSQLPVVLVTSLDSHDAIARGFAAGANDYLTKPVVLTELVSRARRLLAPRVHARAEHVLVADANHVRRNALVAALMTQGLEVIAVEALDDAIGVLDEIPFQLVISDVELGGGNGVALARAMRARDALADIPFVLVTDRTGRVEDVLAASAGVQAVVARPYPPERMLAEVERVLVEARLARQHRALRRYLSGEALAAMERYVDGGAGAVARAAQRHRTILFADIAGFTRMCENRSADEVVDILNRFFDATVPVLVRHGASIDKFIGDCLMAVYDGETQGAVGAVRGALEVMYEVMPVLRMELGVDLQLRVGINSGHVTVGDIGSRDFRRDYTVIGDAVNVAQRLQSNAAVGSVLVSSATRELLGDAFRVGQPQQLAVKGRAGIVEAWPILPS